MWNILIYLLSIYLCLYPWDNPAFNSSFFLGASSLRIKYNLNAFKKIMIKSRFCIYIYKWCSYYVCLIVRRSSINLTLHCSINVYLLFYLPKPTNEDINFNHIVDQKALSKILVGENYFFFSNIYLSPYCISVCIERLALAHIIFLLYVCPKNAEIG